MEYSKLISITGMGGVYELVGSKADGAIVRSLEDKATKFISSRTHQFSHLVSIEVYTVKENINLSELFTAMKENKKELPDYKDVAAVKAYFQEVYPDLDFDRVYTSDLKKMVRWFNILNQNDIEFNQSAEAEPGEEAVDGKDETSNELKETTAASGSEKSDQHVSEE